MRNMLRFVSDEPIKDVRTLAVFGHLFKINSQVHDFQYSVIKEYLSQKQRLDALSVIKDVIFEKVNAASFDACARALAAEERIIKNEIYELLNIVAGIDGFYDVEDYEFFRKLHTYVTFEDDVRVLEENGRILAQRIRKRLKKDNSKYRTGRRSNPTDNLFRISQKEYVKTINDCREVAQADLNVIQPICEDTIAAAERLVERLEENAINSHKSTQEQEIAKALSVFSKKITEGVLKSVCEYGERINRKKAATEDFTIVLVGRTKAGKSTLKSVLTGTGKDEIGRGKQRTTLINYIYEWNHLRIIDTPGIGAGEDEQCADKKIAEKALSEADVVCYLTPSDGVPKDTKQFIREIADSNKPVLVLVNYKKNIRDEDNFEDFLDDPTEWKSEEGRNSLRGYFDPIMRDAQANGYHKMISYYPVFLLAALMAEEENYKEYSKELRMNSGVDEFLASLKIIVVEQGSFLRSKTIIDDTIRNCTLWATSFSNSLKPIENCLATLRDSRASIFRKIDQAQEKFIRDASDAIKDQFRILVVQHAKKFAESHYDQRSGLDHSWKEYCDKIGFDKQVKNAIDEVFEDFQKEVINIFDDLKVDISYELSGNAKLGKLGLDIGLFPMREFTRLLGSALGIGSAIAFVVSSATPIGWVLLGASFVVSIFSNLFKKRAAREKAAQDRLYNKLKEEIEKQSKQVLAEFNKKAHKTTEDAIKKTKHTYDGITKDLNEITMEGQRLCVAWEEQIRKMNVTFAERIVRYIAPEAKAEILDVSRTFGESICITLKCDDYLDAQKLDGLIKEKVMLVYKNMN